MAEQSLVREDGFLPPILKSAEPDPELLNASQPTTRWQLFWQQSQAVIEPRLSWIVALWLIGVACCAIRPLHGLWSQWRLRRVGLTAVSDDVQATVKHLAQRLGLSRAVRIAESACVRVPLVVGYLRPMILLPASVLTGLTPAQLEAVIAHELAHVRRHDWVINALQVLIETLLFYHPAVWWLSHRIHHERELCCDDLALAVLGDKATYGRMLLALEELRQTTPFAAPAASLAATGGNLVQRVRRLLPLTTPPRQPPRRWLTGLAPLALVAACLLTALVHSQAQNDPPNNANGDLRSNPAAGSGDPRRAQQPQSKESLVLFQQWQRTARNNGNIPGGTLGPLVRVMRNFVKNNPTHEGSPKFAELLKRMDVTRDWSRDEAVKLLDEVAAIYPSLPEWVEGEKRFVLGGDVVVGKPLPDELKDAPWGKAQPTGLRVAWLLEPRGAELRLNTPLKSRVVFHNSGKNSVVFRALTWNQSGGHKARDAQGLEIKINSTDWTTIPRTFACRLAPGEFIEVVGAGIGVGANKDDEDWRDARSDFRVGAWIEAQAGDEVTFSPAAVDCDGRDGPQPEDAGAPAAPQSWWLKFITDRVSLDAPLPADAHERGRLLNRAVRDLFGNAPTNEELTAFTNDATPGVFEALAKRLSERPGFEAFSGSLTSGRTKFKVLPVDPDAAKKPRSAKGPGQYTLGGATFVVTRRPIGERVVNEAHLSFSPPDATKPARKTHPVPLPDDYDSWIAAWMRGGTVLWVAQKGADQKDSIRRYDFTNPASVVETVITDLKPSDAIPQAVLDVLHPVTPRSQASAAVDSQPAGLLGRLPHGRKIELVGVAHAVVAGPKGTERKEYGWWQANGTKLDKEPFPLGLVTVPPSKQPLRELAFPWETRPKELASPEQSKLTPMHGGLWFASLRGQLPTVESWDQSGFMHYQVALPFESEQPGAMAFYYSDDVVIEAGVLGLDGKIEPGTNATARTKSLLQFVDVAGGEKSATETIVTLRPSMHRWPMQVFLFAISPDGTRIHPVDPNERDRHVFKVPAAEIEGFQINLRPMTHRVVVENIALLPGQKTEPKLTIDSLDALVSVKFRKNGKTLGRIGEIRLSQLEEMLKDMQHDLNSETGELIVGSHSAASSEEAERIVAKLKAGGWKWPVITVTQQSPFVDAVKENAAVETSPPVGLEFLQPYPKLHGLSLDMTEPQFLEIVKQQELKTTKHGEGDKTAYWMGLGDGLTLIVMFHQDGTCRGIQRIRGEDEVSKALPLNSGQVIAVDQNRGVAVISLGAGDTVKRLMKFEVRVRGPARDKAGKPAVKGIVEAVQVDEDTSKVRIIQQDAANEITVGDYVIPVPEKLNELQGRGEQKQEAELPPARPQAELGNERQGSRLAPILIDDTQPDDPRLVIAAGSTLEQLVGSALWFNSRRLVTAEVHSPWQITQWIGGVGREARLRKSATDRGTMLATQWLAGGAKWQDQPLWRVTEFGAEGHPFTRPYEFEGHPGQFLAMLADADLPLDFQLTAFDDNGQTKPVTVRDLVQDARQKVAGSGEKSWLLRALAHYEPPTAEWTLKSGEVGSIEQLVRHETERSANGAPDLGGHNLFALAVARNRYVAAQAKATDPLPQPWLAADEKLTQHIAKTKRLQNKDGSLSANGLIGPGLASKDFQTRLRSTSPQLRWLVVALPQAELTERWLQRAVEHLARDLITHRQESIDVDPLAQATHALRLYRDRTRNAN